MKTKEDLAQLVIVRFNLSFESFNALPIGMASELVVMIEREKELIEALRCAATQDPSYWQDIVRTAIGKWSNEVGGR